MPGCGQYLCAQSFVTASAPLIIACEASSVAWRKDCRDSGQQPHLGARRVPEELLGVLLRLQLLRSGRLQPVSRGRTGVVRCWESSARR